LTDRQIKKLDTLKFNTEKKVIQMRSEIKIAELELKKMMHGEDVDMLEIRKKMEKNANKHAQIKFLQFKSRKEISSILTEKQLEFIKNLKKEQGSRAGCR